MPPSPKRTFILGLGFQRCGTTWLHRYLSRSPAFDGGFAKEYHIWDALDISVTRRNRVRGPAVLNRIRSHETFLRQRMQNSQDFYFEYFQSLYNSGVSISADITPSYSGLRVDRLKFIDEKFDRAGIECKAVILLRDPVQRIMSAVRYNLGRKNYNEGINFGERNFERAVEQYYITEHCRIRNEYHITVESARAAFGRHRVYVGIYENMFDRAEVARLSEFCGVEPEESFSSTVFNRTYSGNLLPNNLRDAVYKQYAEVYEYCYENFPQTRDLWGHAARQDRAA